MWSVPCDAAVRFLRGDSNADGLVNISDASFTLGFLFLGTPLSLACKDAADSNDDGTVNLSDAVHTLGYLFLGTSAPPPPFGLEAAACGEDPTPDALDCGSFPPCAGTNLPPHAAFSASARTGVVPLKVDFDASASNDPDGQVAAYLWDFGDGATAQGAKTAHTFDRTGSFTVSLTVKDDGGATSSSSLAVVARDPDVPPDPSDVAPPLDGTSVPSFAGAVSFLYAGADPVQTGVDPSSIVPTRAAVLRGRVTDRAGDPLRAVTVTVPAHLELGSTLTRPDGRFDLAVNGGGLLTVAYERSGFLPAQRQVDVPWNDYAWLPDVALVEADAQVTAVDLSGGMQAARGSPVADADGSRQATVLFPQGTTAEMVMPDGSKQPLAALHVRATEFTAGEKGPEAMPAELPPTSGYTYCVELSADEALAAGAASVRFGAPLPFYVENFLGFPVGTVIPLGSYDRARGAWMPEESGKVVKVLSVTGGAADLDVDGDGTADTGAPLSALGITDAERRQLTALYAPGQALWRVRIPHFSAWDTNMALIPPPDAVFAAKDPRRHQPFDDDCTVSGSIIEVRNQILGEAVPVRGTPFYLRYGSERVPGRKEGYTVEIPLSGDQLPKSLLRIELEVSVAGQFSHQSFPPSPNQSITFTWDGRNSYGQVLQGTQPILVRIGYVYHPVYGSTTRFGYSSPEAITLSPARDEITLWRNWRDKVGAWDARGNGLGGWTLSVHHAYEPGEQILYRGDGGRESARRAGPKIDTSAGTGAFGSSGDGGPATEASLDPQGVAAGPDGSLYIACPLSSRVRRVAPDGTITTAAGGGNPCPPGSGPCGDGGPAAEAQLGSPFSVAVGPDGSLYIGEALSGRQVVRKVDPSGVIRTVAGTGPSGFSGDEGPATSAQLGSVVSLAVGPDGSLYIADEANRRIRRVAPDGIITTVAGTGVGGSSEDGVPATNAQLISPRGVAVGGDGTLCIADTGTQLVRAVTPDGIIRTIAGTGTAGFSGDGGPATDATLKFPSAVAVRRDGTVFILDSGNLRVRWMRPGGTIATLAGIGLASTTGDAGLARQAALQDIQTGLAVGPDGSVFVSQSANNLRVRRIAPPTESFLEGAGGEIVVPTGDGGEAFVFDLGGRNLRTLDPLTGALRYRFTYDAAGRLATVVDGDGNATTVERDGNGNPTAIVGPYGHVTTLALNSDGFLERITDPAGETVRMAYTPDGLLTALTDPLGHVSSYAYDPLGRLVAATDPTGATKTLARSGTNEDFTVTLTTALGKTALYRVEIQENGDRLLTNVGCAGTSSQATIGTDGRLSATYADGSRVDLVLGPDPRWGMRAPLAASVTTSTPGGRSRTTTRTRTVELAAPGDLLHLRSRTDSMTTNGRTWTSAYDSQSRTLVVTSPAGRRGSVRFDERGRPVAAQPSDLDPIAFTYDARGRLATLEQGEGEGPRVASLAYGPDGFLAVLTDPLGRTTALVRDGVGRVTEETLPGGRTFRLAYDANGNVLGITPPGRLEHTVNYSPRNEVAAYTPPAAGAEAAVIRYAYDADRHPTRIDQPGGSAVRFQYEGNTCRLELVDLGGRRRTYGYDAAGRLISLDSSQGVSLVHTYADALLTGATWSGAIAGSVTWTLDGDFRVDALRVNGADPVAISYDADGLAVQVGGMTLTRSPESGRIVATSLGSLSDAVTYNGFGEPVSFTVRHGEAILYSVAYTCDALGRILEKVETIGGKTRTVAFAYDPSDRLAEARRDGAVAASYGYDPNGNRLSRTDAGGTLNATHDAQDRLIAYGSTAYAHNSKGERTGRTAGGQATTYRYDGLGNLVGVTLPDGTQIEYLLDARDRRVGKRVGGALVQGFLYQDRLRPIAELNGAGAVVSRFVYATGGTVPDYMVRGGATYRIVTDHLGSPRLVIDATTGEVVQQMDHDEFGRVVLDTNPGFQPFGFAGGLYDRQTGLVHFGAREYDPETGRWTAKDPIGFGGGDGNLYAYAGNDAVNRVDPGGLIYSTLCYAGPALVAAGIIVRAGPVLTQVSQAGANVLSNAGNLLQEAGDAVESVIASCAESAPGLANAVPQAEAELEESVGTVESVAPEVQEFVALTSESIGGQGPVIPGGYTEAQWAWVLRMLELTEDLRLENALSGDPALLERAKETALLIFRLGKWVSR